MMMFIIVMFSMILLLPMTFALSISIYNNSRFDPADSYFIVNNFYPVVSLTNCICHCDAEVMCLTAFYDGMNQTCRLFFAQLSQGTLSLVFSNRRNTVLTFKNKTLPDPSILTNNTENPFSIWNTTAGSNSPSTTGGSLVSNLIQGDEATNLFDRNLTTKYSNYGACTILNGLISSECGRGSGIYLTLQRGASLLVAFRIGTGSLSGSYDPMTITIEGSNQLGTALRQGSSWTLLYNGTTGLDIDPGRKSIGPMIFFSIHSKIFSSYRLLITSKRGNVNLVQYSEFQLFGY